MLESLMRAGIWTMILSIVIVMPLIMTENLILNNPLLSVGQFSTITGGAGLAGFISGFIGQVFFDYFSSRIVQILLGQPRFPDVSYPAERAFARLGKFLIDEHIAYVIIHKNLA